MMSQFCLHLNTGAHEDFDPFECFYYESKEDHLLC